LPVVHSFGCFLSTRPNEQIYNNASEGKRIIYVGGLSGIVPGGPGHSHQSVRDIAALGAVPGLVMIEPSCEEEVAKVLDYCVNYSEESCYLRLVSVPWVTGFELPADYQLREGHGVALTEGADAVMFAYGPVMLGEAVHTAEQLRSEHGIGLRVVNLPWLNRLDENWLRDEVSGARAVFTIDNHYRAGGQGQMVCATLSEQGLSAGTIVQRFGLDGFPACGTNQEVLRAHGLDAKSLTASIVRLLGQ
jgi:transketolase